MKLYFPGVVHCCSNLYRNLSRVETSETGQKGIEKTDGMHCPCDPVASLKRNLDLISLSNSNTYTEFKSKAVGFFKLLIARFYVVCLLIHEPFPPTHKYELPLLNARRQPQAYKPGNLRLWQLLLMQKISAELFQGGKWMLSTAHVIWMH